MVESTPYDSLEPPPRVEMDLPVNTCDGEIRGPRAALNRVVACVHIHQAQRRPADLSGQTRAGVNRHHPVLASCLVQTDPPAEKQPERDRQAGGKARQAACIGQMDSPGNQGSQDRLG